MPTSWMCNAAWIDAVRTVAEQRNTNSDESTARKGSVGEWWGVSEENGEDEGRRGAVLFVTNRDLSIVISGWFWEEKAGAVERGRTTVASCSSTSGRCDGTSSVRFEFDAANSMSSSASSKVYSDILFL
ncbi:hypothetical protein BLNAU_3435 [Blattamonas nauphoetae]|uniref:Uncharacterized protein n=1 Tax=Blattamonas nauphoetae TaxID=2049346 RepID=A0ABQ9YCZ7_9EUKA|nr:hypothetical protein BLNAU_3435 [Blattamonas nauphoetae]